MYIYLFIYLLPSVKHIWPHHEVAACCGLTAIIQAQLVMLNTEFEYYYYYFYDLS